MIAHKLYHSAVAIAFLGLATMLLAPSATAAVWTWDYNSTGGIADGSGIWNTSSTNWWNSSADTTWVNGSTNTALFGVGSPAANPYVVDLGSGSISTGGVTFQNQAYTITNGTLNLASPTVTVNSAAGATIGATITAANGLTETGSGILTLTGPLSYTGTTAVSAGTLTFNGSSGTIGEVHVGTTSGSGTAGMYFHSGNVTSTGLLDTGYLSGGTSSYYQDGGAVSFKGLSLPLVNVPTTFTLTGGTFASTAQGQIGQTGPMTYNQSGGLFNFNTGAAGGFLQTAFQTTAPTTMSISGGTFQVASNNILYLGCRTSSTVTISGNALVTTGTLSFNRAAATAGTAASVVNLNGGILQPTVILESYNNTVGTGGTLNFNGGTLQASPIAVAAWIPANIHLTLNVNGGGAFIDTNGQNVTIAQAMMDGSGGTADSLTKLNSGVLTLTGASTYQGTTTVGGGTLQIGNGGSLNAAGLIAVNAGATLAFNRNDSPTQGFDFSSSGVSGAGGLAMVGSGLLTLNATNTYSGPTNISAGTLAVNGALTQTSTISVGTAATLGGSGLIGGNASSTTLTGNGTINLSGGTIGGPLNATGGNWTGTGTVNGLVTASSNVFTVANGGSLNAAGNMNLSGGTLTGQGAISGGTLTLGSGAVIAPGNAANTNNIGTLTLPSLATGGGGTLSFDLSNVNTAGVNDLIQFAGNVSLGGTTTLSIYPTAGSLATGTPYTLFNYGGNLSHSGVLAVVAPGAIGGRQSAAINYGSGSNSAVTMTISGFSANLTWIGTSTTTWANNSSIKPWTSPTSPSGDFFASADNCTFDNNTAAGATSVTLSGTLLPGSITVTGSNNFTFSGGGVIGGLTGLTLTGPGSLTIANSGNNYTGATLVQSSTLAAGANNALSPASGLVLGSSAGNGTVDLAGFSQSVASLGTDPSAAAANQTIGNSAASTTATLTISGSSTYGGTIQDGLNGSGGQTALTVAGGLVNLSGSNTYSGPTTINNGGTLQLGSYSALGAGANAGNLVANGILDLQGNPATVGAISGSGTVADSFGFATLNFGSAANSTFSGAFQSLNLSQTGAGTFVLTGANSATTTTINQGTFQVGNGSLNGNAGSSQYSIAGGARLYFNQGTAPVTSLTWANITGGGTLELNDAAPGAVFYSQLALPSGFFGTLQVDHFGVATADSNGLGGTTTVIVNSGAQFMASNSTSGAYTFPQNFSIAGLGNLSGSNSGAIVVSQMNATLSGSISLTADSGLYTKGGSSVLTVTGPISGNFGLTIADGNTLSPIVLAGVNTYSGPTNIVAGTLAVNGSLLASGSVAVAASGAGLTGSGSVGATTVNAGGKILGGYNNIGSLTLASLTFSSSANVFGALGNSTTSPAPIIVNGALTASASTILVNLTGTLPTVAGTYPFLQYGWLAGSGTAAFQFASPLRAYSLTNVTGATNYLGVTYNPGVYPIWTGSNSTAFAGGTNWKLSTDSSPTDYLNLDNVVFDDSATGTTTVSVTQSVTPASTTFSNSTLSYTLTGTSGIAGAGSLTKSGTGGLLTITNSNGYTGGTFVNGGTLQLGNGGTTGSITGPINVAAGATLVNSFSTAGATFSNSVSGQGNWVLQGPGAVVQTGFAKLTGSNSGFSGIMYANSGARVEIDAGANLPGSGGTISVASGGELYEGSNTLNAGTPLTLAGIGWAENNGFLGALRLSGGTQSGNIALTSNASVSTYFSSFTTSAITGVISGNYQLEMRTGINSSSPAHIADVLTLAPTAANTYGSTRVNSSMNGGNNSVTLAAGNANAFSTGPLSLAGTVSSTAVVKLNGFNFSFADLSSDNAYTQIQNGSASAASTISVGGDNANTTYSGTLIDGGALPLALTMTGSGSLTLSGTNGYTGGTTVNGGTLIVTNSGAIVDGTSLAVGDPSLLSLLPAAIVPAPAAAPAIAPVPEPGTLLLMAFGACSAAVYRRLRRTRALSAGKC